MTLSQGHCPNCESRALVHANDVLPRLDQPKMRVCIDCGGLWVLLSPAEHEYWVQRMEQKQMKPTIGRIVHYTNLGDKDGRYPPETQAAIITAVNDDGTCALKIFYRTGIFDMAPVPYSEEPRRGHWNWPPRV